MTFLFVTHSVDEDVFLSDRIVIMTARPGRISEVIPVDLPHSRNRTSPEVNLIKDRVLRILQENSNTKIKQKDAAVII